METRYRQCVTSHIVASAVLQRILFGLCADHHRTRKKYRVAVYAVDFRLVRLLVEDDALEPVSARVEEVHSVVVPSKRNLWKNVFNVPAGQSLSEVSLQLTSRLRLQQVGQLARTLSGKKRAADSGTTREVSATTVFISIE